MNKNGMSLTTLVVVMIVVIGIMYLFILGLAKTNLVQEVKATNAEMDLLNVQQLANMAYANIYLDNLRQGIRRELTSSEVRARMLKNGMGEIDLNKYNIIIENGDVFVTLRGEQ